MAQSAADQRSTLSFNHNQSFNFSDGVIIRDLNTYTAGGGEAGGRDGPSGIAAGMAWPTHINN